MSWIAKHRKADPCLLKPSGVPERFKGFALADIKTAGVRAAVTGYLANIDAAASRGLAPAFFGRGGTYKTFAAAYVALAIEEKLVVQVAFVSCASTLPRLERSRFDESTARQLAYYAQVPFLVVDDFDCVAQGSWGADRLLELADSRYGAVLPTLWTGNVLVTKTDQTQLTQKYGQAFARRVWEGSEGYRVAIR